MNKVDPSLSIPAFYAGKSVFITGGSGFMGKILVEKLLYSCPDIKEIFLLIRPKKSIGVDDRLKKMLELPVSDCFFYFSLWKILIVNWIKKK